MLRLNNGVARYLGSAARLGCWLLVLLGTAAALYLCGGAQPDPDVPQDEAARPAGQTARDHRGGPVSSLAFSRDGDRLASATLTGEVWISHPMSAGPSRVRRGPIGSAQELAFSPDGRVLAVAGGGAEVWLWDAEAATELAPLDVGGGVSGARRFAFSGDGTRLAVGGHGDAITVWDWCARRRLAVLGGHPCGVTALALSADGARLASGDAAGWVKVWDVTTGRARAHFGAYEREAPVTSLALTPDGELLATASVFDRTVRLWDACSGAPRGTLPGMDAGVFGLAFSPEGSVLAVALGDGTAVPWGIARGTELGSIRPRSGSLRSIVFSGDGRVLATGAVDGSVRLWNMADVLRAGPPGG
jgi:WD40 repeat protein